MYLNKTKKNSFFVIDNLLYLQSGQFHLVVVWTSYTNFFYKLLFIFENNNSLQIKLFDHLSWPTMQVANTLIFLALGFNIRGAPKKFNVLASVIKDRTSTGRDRVILRGKNYHDSICTSLILIIICLSNFSCEKTH